MTTPGHDGPFSSGFMDDYFAEAEEHMIAVRRGLLAVEDALGSDPPPGVLEELFRSFHSLKGISAMVELREAELLAHHMESCLRAVRQGHLTLTATSLEVLVDGARMLDRVIDARRSSSELPSIEALAEALESVARGGGPGAPGSPVTPAVSSPTVAPSGARLWRVTLRADPGAGRSWREGGYRSRAPSADRRDRQRRAARPARRRHRVRLRRPDRRRTTARGLARRRADVCAARDQRAGPAGRRPGRLRSGSAAGGAALSGTCRRPGRPTSFASIWRDSTT